MAEGRGTIGGLISAACADQHLHKGAYGIFRRLDKMDDYKRAELLFHLDTYRERAKWDESDLFDRLKGQIQRDCQFHIVVTRLEVGGYCAQCRSASKQ